MVIKQMVINVIGIVAYNIKTINIYYIYLLATAMQMYYKMVYKNLIGFILYVFEIIVK